MSSVSDEDFKRFIDAQGAGRGGDAPIKARLLPMDEAPGTKIPPYSVAPTPAQRPWLWISLQVMTVAVAGFVGWYSATHGGKEAGDRSAMSEVTRLAQRLAASEDQARERDTALRKEQISEMAALRKLMENVGRDIEGLRSGQRSVQATGEDTARKWTQLAERLDKLEAAQIPTASIARAIPQATVPPLPRPVVAKTTPAAPASSPSRSRPPTPPPGGYILGEVHSGGAVVHGHRGPVEVAPGTLLPGAGRVQAILRRNGQWVVTTTNGEIDSDGY